MQKLKHYAKEIFFFFAFLLIFSNAISLYKSSDLNKQQLSSINLELLDGSFYKIDTSKPILVHFWATWCPTCKLEAQNIQSIHEDYQLISIAVNSGSAYDIQDYLDERKLTYATCSDENGSIAKRFNVVAYPTTFVYDKKGNLVFSEVGYTSTWGLWLRMWWAEL